MQLIDHLQAFSIDDLRKLAARRRLALSSEARVGRQTLVRSIASALGHYAGIFTTILRLSQPELLGLEYVLEAERRAALSAFAARFELTAEQARDILESLRLWGLIFPEGDWEHIAVPPVTRHALTTLREADVSTFRVAPPPLVFATGVATAAREGSLERDLAECLARVARGRLRLVRSGRLHRRDLRALQTAVPIAHPHYAGFAAALALGFGLLEADEERLLRVPAVAVRWLAAAATDRRRSLVRAWRELDGFAECDPLDPTDPAYLPRTLPDQREGFLATLSALEPGVPVTVASLAARIEWQLPLSFQTWDNELPAGTLTERLARTLYWYGVVSVDDPDTPRHIALTPEGARILAARPVEASQELPEDPYFIVQPNAEVFAPPNLSPHSYFQLRRLTGEKRDGPVGIFRLTAESLRAALDAGVGPEEITGFLEGASRTGLPATVRELIRTVARQHGRIRLVPAGYVLVADEPSLLAELQSVRSVATLLGAAVTDRTAVVSPSAVPALLRALRDRGYSPADYGHEATAPPLLPAADPEVSGEPGRSGDATR